MNHLNQKKKEANSIHLNYIDIETFKTKTFQLIFQKNRSMMKSQWLFVETKHQWMKILKLYKTCIVQSIQATK